MARSSTTFPKATPKPPKPVSKRGRKTAQVASRFRNSKHELNWIARQVTGGRVQSLWTVNSTLESEVAGDHVREAYARTVEALRPGFEAHASSLSGARGATAYLVALACAGVPLAACAAAGVDRRWPNRWRASVEGFSDLEEQAMACYRESLEIEAHRRSFVGTVEPVVAKGEIVGTKRVYSDRLLEQQLAARHPDYARKLSVQSEHRHIHVMVPVLGGVQPASDSADLPVENVIEAGTAVDVESIETDGLPNAHDAV